MSILNTFKKLPGVFAMKRSIVITDAILENIYTDEREPTPVKVIRHGIRGTQNLVKDADKPMDQGAGEDSVSNIQEIDTARLEHDADRMLARFSLRFLPIEEAVTSCAPSKNESSEIIKDFRDSIERFISRAKGSDGLKEVALRYVRNIVNGRWLWRNRLSAESITVFVSVDGGEPVSFDALSYSLNSFENFSDAELNIAQRIIGSLTATSSVGTTINVSAEIDFGVRGAIEVYPSQNYIPGDNSNKKEVSRSLYKYGARKEPGDNCVGYAAIRDQKIGNALRTFDTWYSEFEHHNMPIAIEPNGASLDAQRFFRKASNGASKSAFKLFLALDSIDVNSPDGMFVIASIIRGGVYSESNKKDADGKKVKKNSASSPDSAQGDLLTDGGTK